MGKKLKLLIGHVTNTADSWSIIKEALEMDIQETQKEILRNI